MFIDLFIFSSSHKAPVIHCLEPKHQVQPVPLTILTLAATVAILVAVRQITAHSQHQIKIP